MGSQTTLAVMVGTVAGLVGYLAYTRSDALSALVVIAALSWFIYRFSSPNLAWKTFSMLTLPPATGLIFFLAGFIFFSFQGTPFWVTLVVSAGLAFIGAVVGMILHKYWNIAG